MKKEEKGRNNGYDEILRDALNEDSKSLEENKDSTGFLDFQLFTTRWGKFVLLFLSLNILWFVVSDTGRNGYLSKEAADLELKEKYGEGHKEFVAIDSLVGPQTRSKRDLSSNLAVLNDAYRDEEDQEASVFIEDYFYFIGDVVFYAEPERE